MEKVFEHKIDEILNIIPGRIFEDDVEGTAGEVFDEYLRETS